MIGYAFCGSFCTMKKSVGILGSLAMRGYDLLPVMSFNAFTTDTRFGTAEGFVREISDICKKEPVTTIAGAEPLGPKTPLDALIICPCTGNTLAKLAAGITDTPVTMAAKAHMRQSRPLLIALASNDAMSANLKNIAALLEKKNVFFVPAVQDDPEKKPHSLVADFSLVPECLELAPFGKAETAAFSFVSLLRQYRTILSA